MSIDRPEIRSFQPPVRTLMGPGPSDVPPRVLSALARAVASAARLVVSVVSAAPRAVTSAAIALASTTSAAARAAISASRSPPPPSSRTTPATPAGPQSSG